MAKWSTGSETGILRKPAGKDKFEDLLVFGYACKVFRDDEKALFIDQGKHLIPWMGDRMLKIDRYDCRGALSELKSHESSDHDASRGDSERRLELLCDEERYYALKYNEEELEMYQEEATKRLQQKGTEFQYNYDVPGNPELPENQADVQDQDEVYVPLPELSVPADMEVPKTVKEHARIEKTALFISNQGPQMEILIKTKQADNPQFSFMNKEHSLCKYYKHLVSAIKSGQYKVQLEAPPASDEQAVDTSNEQDDHDDHYLHPSLVAPTAQQPAQPPAPPLPTVIYKPSADCSYSQLVSRIQGSQLETATPPPVPQISAQDVPQGQMTLEQQQYYQQYYYAAQYYEYYNQMTQQLTGQNADQSPGTAPDNCGITPEQLYTLYQKNAEFQNIIQSQTAYQQFMQQQQEQPTNPYAQLVTNLSQANDSHPATIPPLPPTNDISKAPILYNKPDSEPPVVPAAAAPTPLIGPQLPDPIPDEPTTKPEETVTTQQPILSLVQYGSDSEQGSDDDDETETKTPPHDLQQIIDKMAIYVSKNGKDFENIVKAKEDPRFQFLNSEHVFNRYYKKKLDESMDVQENGIVEKPKEKKVIAPVSFSIKKPKDETQKEIKSALPVEESSDDEHENTTVAVVKTLDPPEMRSLTPPLKDAPAIPAQPNLTNEKGVLSQDVAENGSNNKQTDADELFLEMIDVAGDLVERRESKRVENIKKDKITAAVKERIALQSERKKKAAAFLRLKTNNTPPKPECKTPKQHKETVAKTPTRCNKTKRKANSEVERLVVDEIISIDDSEVEEGEIKKHKKSKKKKSHKRKRSKSRHESKRSKHHKTKSKEHKKSKKRRKKSVTSSSDSSESS